VQQPSNLFITQVQQFKANMFVVSSIAASKASTVYMVAKTTSLLMLDDDDTHETAPLQIMLPKAR
jgi:hypothetical protein